MYLTRTPKLSPKLSPLSLLAAAALTLAACADQGTGGDAPDASATATAPAAAPTDGDTRVGLSKCREPENGRVHFRVGQTVFAVPPRTIKETIPTGLTPPYTPQTVKAALERQTATGAGCPEKPLDLLVLAVKTDLGDPLLEGTIGFLATNPDQLSTGYAGVTDKLQQNPPQDCQRMGGELLACAGTESAGNRQAQVMYLITQNRALRMNSGGPLAARCAMNEGKVQGCNIIDRGPDGVIFDAILAEGDYSTDAILSAWRAANSGLSTLVR